MSEKAKDVLHVRSQQIMASAELLAQQTSDWQVLQAYVSGRLRDMPVTPVQQRKLERYQFVYNQLVSGKYTEVEVCEMLQITFKIDDKPLSYVQALHDIRDTKELWSTTINLKKLFELRVELEIVNQHRAMAVAAGDMRAAAQLGKNKAKLIEMMPDEEDSIAEDFTPHINVITFDPSLLGYGDLDKLEMQRVLKDIKAKYGGDIDVSIGDFEDAEIVEE